MSDGMNPEQGRGSEISESGLLKSVEPMYGGGSLSAAGADADAHGREATDVIGGDTDTTDATDADTTDAIGGDADGTDESEAGDTDVGDDEPKSESGLVGESPLGLNRGRTGGGKDTRDS
ncbi:MAG: hypothetical protein M3R15_22130 [Acidobacteriota bacterium]|nr:hypothetical protein [Acidobacteriota bacterium]